jgi:hypothetical protein
MAEDDKVKIHFICEAQTEDSPPVRLLDEIAGQLVEPAIPPTIDYTLNRGDFSADDGALDHFTVDMMATDRLVIADLSDLTPTAYFILGARSHRRLPIVYICDETAAVRRDLRTHRIVRYSMEDLPGSVMDLREEIEIALADDNYPHGTAPQLPVPPLPPREMRLELANRIEATADVIRTLRINSVSASVDELVAIADELKTLPDENSPSRLQEAADKSLKVIFALLDEISSQPGARMAITGAIALIVGGTGAPGAGAFSAGLAFWYGKEVFTKWIAAWRKRNNPPKRSKQK